MSYGVGEKLQICDRDHDAITFLGKHDSDCPLCAAQESIDELNRDLERQRDEYEEKLNDASKDVDAARDEANGLQNTLDDTEAEVISLKETLTTITSERDEYLKQLETLRG